MTEKEFGSNILSSNATDYASFLGKRFDQFNKIENSGYGLYWFPQCFYNYWNERNMIEGLELWGNMGPHYTSGIVSQFSEVMVTQNDAEYKSNIYILVLCGKGRRIREELSNIKNNISSELLPFKVFLVRFDRLVASQKDPNIAGSDLLFKDLSWIPNFRTRLCDRLHWVSIGVLERDFQSYVDTLPD